MFKERGNLSVMRVLKQFIFMALVVIGFSMTAMAQRQDDNQNRPPKQNPPVIIPPDKDRPKPDRPPGNNNNNRPKKPQEAIFISSKQTEISVV
jgi:hypothetical protein